MQAQVGPVPRCRHCDGCGRPPAVCLCSALPVPRLPTNTRVVILQHPKEARRKVVKTAELIALCLASNCCKILTGKDFSSELATLSQRQRPHDRCLLLWPGAEATPINALPPPRCYTSLDSDAKVHPSSQTTLVVLDGTWQQAKQIHALNKATLDELCVQVSFPADVSSTSVKRTNADPMSAEVNSSRSGWIRLQPRDHFLSTLESVGLALQTLEGQQGPRILAALLHVFDRMNERQRVFYTEEKAHAPILKQKKEEIKAMEATLVEPTVPCTDGKPKLFVLCREERTAEDRRVMRQVGNPALCTFDEAQRQCKRINEQHGRSRGSRFCVRTPWSESESESESVPEPQPQPEPETETETQTEHVPGPVEHAGFAALLTVVITTSPTAGNPCTRLIRAIVRSFAMVKGLMPCRKLIVCDGYVQGQKCSFKKGRITESAVGAYEQYLRELQHLIGTDQAFANAELMILEKRHGFGFAIRRALEKVDTRFILVVQHDRLITRPFDLGSVLRAFDAFPQTNGRPLVKYIAFQTRQTVGGAHQLRVRSRRNGKHVVFPKPLTLPYTLPAEEPGRQGMAVSATGGCDDGEDAAVHLEPLAFWYDSTHCCEAEHYREFIFQETKRREEHIPDEDSSRTRLRLGDFVEDTVGHQLLDAVKEAGTSESGFNEAHELYGTYLWDDGIEEVHVRHIDGRKYLSPEQRVELGYSAHGLTKFEQFETASTQI